MFSLKPYFSTPIICFDLKNDCHILKNKYPKNVIISARDIDQGMYDEISNYFKILAAYATGMIDKIEISDKDIVQNFELMKLFRTPVKYISGNAKDILEISGVIDLIKEYGKPVVVEG